MSAIAVRALRAAMLVFCCSAAWLCAPAWAQAPLRFAWPSNVGPLNPHLYTPNQMFAQSMVYEPLVKYQADGQVAPWLAQSWETSDDGRVYTFHLRRDVTFSNGEPFDAPAVVANFRAVLANRERNAWLELTNQIQAVDAVDAHTVRLTLAHPYYPLLQELALPRPFRFIAPSQFVDGGTATGIVKPIGTGPWMLVETHLGERDVFVRNPHYWGAPPAYDEVEVDVIPDPNARAIAFETRQVDLLYGMDGPVSPDMFQRFKAMDGVSATLSAPMETRFLALNSAQGPTADVAVRKAINHAVDKDTMITAVLYGAETRADTLFAPNVPYANIGLAPYRYDPARANQLLDEAGWTYPPGQGVRYRDGQPLAMALVFVGTDAVAKSMAEIVQADLAKVGMAVSLVSEEESSVYARQRDGRFGMVFSRTWGAPYDPHAFVSSMRAPSHADYQAQRGLPDKARIDAEISKVLLSSDENERRALYRDILTRLHDEAVYLPLTYVPVMAVARQSLGAIPFGAMASDIPFARLQPGAH